ncbi:aminotransferase class V-fold PLP-dependent enzyme [Mongoliitalea daihaiensis]|nr:aminotransferase class V-fold PLP-dependent enzyme [Mongoliitalea daihaiensis]
MSPLLRSVEEAGYQALIKKRNPTQIKPVDFFTTAARVKGLFAQLVQASTQQIAIIPSASYGLMTAIKNLPTNQGSKVLVVSDEFPSGYYTAERWCLEHGQSIAVVPAPEVHSERGALWNQQILAAIDDSCTAIVISTIHWADGTIFDLETIGEACQKHNCHFIVDGTQSVGAMPIDVNTCRIDALVCAGYKWMMGPYASGLAYYSKKYNHGKPLEESWMNRANAENFAALTNYTSEYSEGAGRFNMGEFSSFNLMPMLEAALIQLLEWTPEMITAYVDELAKPLIAFCKANGFWVEEEDYRAKHLFSIGLPSGIERTDLLKALEEAQVYVSVRGEGIRVSLHLFNTQEDIQAFIDVLSKSL